MWERLFGEPEISGLRSDAFWFGLFVGVFLSFAAMFVLAFAIFPVDVAVELLPFLLVLALLLSYPIALGAIWVLTRLVVRIERYRSGPDLPEELL